MRNSKFALLMIFCILPTIFVSSPARAGVFNIPQFVDYKNWAVGLEPVFTLTSPKSVSTENSGAGFNLKFTYGITPISNLQLGIGDGSGTKGFRLGGTYSWDIIPNLEHQIGAGIALEAYTYKLKSGLGETEITVYPYAHNLYHAEALDYDPYIALPVGEAFYNGTYRTILQMVLGTFFKTSPYFGFNAELGMNLKDTDTYISLGGTYRN